MTVTVKSSTRQRHKKMRMKSASATATFIVLTWTCLISLTVVQAFSSYSSPVTGKHFFNIRQKQFLTTSTCNSSRTACIRNQIIQHNGSPSSKTAIYSSFNEGLEESNIDGDQGNRKGNFLKVAALKIRSTFQGMVSFFTVWRKAIVLMYSKLSKRAKIVVAAQTIFFSVLFGGLVYKNAVSSPRARIPPPVEVTYSHFLDLCDWSGKGHEPGKHPAIKISKPIVVRGDRVSFVVEPDDDKHQLALSDPKLVRSNDKSVQTFEPMRAYARKPLADANLMNYLRDKNMSFMAGKSATKRAAVATQFTILGMYFFIMIKMYQNMNGGGKDPTGKLARNAFNPDTAVKFDDIEGIDEAKFEVMELVDALRNPAKYAILGARAPKGILLVGPPGTGKTMLAKAVATTAGVPLLYCSGSDFVEMYVGRGAARVRRTFEKAMKLAPCIVFIDELDALGKKRNQDLDNFIGRGSNDEQEQTLNQLLACMDGLDSMKGVCVLAATNRKEVLDTALTRPGRFDRIVTVPLPDSKGREAILRVHASKLPGFEECKGVDSRRPGSLGVGNAVDLSAVAAVTNGCCGAELEFIVNEAAIRAVRRVSSLLRQGIDVKSIQSPHVNAEDFEGSLSNFFSSRGKSKVNIPNIFGNSNN